MHLVTTGYVWLILSPVSYHFCLYYCRSHCSSLLAACSFVLVGCHIDHEKENLHSHIHALLPAFFALPLCMLSTSKYQGHLHSLAHSFSQ